MARRLKKWYNISMIIWRTIRVVTTGLGSDIIYFPVWWYGAGTYRVLQIIFGQVREQAAAVNLGILVRNLFVPMFGQYDIWGRIISAGVRLVHFAILFIYAVLWTILLIILLLIWLILPFFILYNILLHLGILPNYYPYLYGWRG